MFKPSISYGGSIGVRYLINNMYRLLMAYKYANGPAYKCQGDRAAQGEIDPCVDFIRKRSGNVDDNSQTYGGLSMHTGRFTELGKDVLHRTIQYLNNLIEQDQAGDQATIWTHERPQISYVSLKVL